MPGEWTGPAPDPTIRRLAIAWAEIELAAILAAARDGRQVEAIIRSHALAGAVAYAAREDSRP